MAVMLLLIANGAAIIYIAVVLDKALPVFLENSFSSLVLGFLGLLVTPRDKKDDAPPNDDSS